MSSSRSDCARSRSPSPRARARFNATSSASACSDCRGSRDEPLGARAQRAGVVVHLDLNEDQIALRDGIRSLLDGRFTSARVRAGYDRAMHDELAEAGVFTLLADGFTL